MRIDHTDIRFAFWMLTCALIIISIAAIDNPHDHVPSCEKSTTQ